jgi:hypothetical protein
MALCKLGNPAWDVLFGGVMPAAAHKIRKMLSIPTGDNELCTVQFGHNSHELVLRLMSCAVDAQQVAHRLYSWTCALHQHLISMSSLGWGWASVVKGNSSLIFHRVIGDISRGCSLLARHYIFTAARLLLVWPQKGSHQMMICRYSLATMGGCNVWMHARCLVDCKYPNSNRCNGAHAGCWPECIAAPPVSNVVQPFSSLLKLGCSSYIVASRAALHVVRKSNT